MFIKLKLYFKDIYNELVYNVSWPSIKKLRVDSIVVLISSLIFSFIIFFMDKIFENILNGVFNFI